MVCSILLDRYNQQNTHDHYGQIGRILLQDSTPERVSLRLPKEHTKVVRADDIVLESPTDSGGKALLDSTNTSQSYSSEVADELVTKAKSSWENYRSRSVPLAQEILRQMSELRVEAEPLAGIALRHLEEDVGDATWEARVGPGKTNTVYDLGQKIRAEMAVDAPQEHFWSLESKRGDEAEAGRLKWQSLQRDVENLIRELDECLKYSVSKSRIAIKELKKGLTADLPNDLTSVIKSLNEIANELQEEQPNSTLYVKLKSLKRTLQIIDLKTEMADGENHRSTIQVQHMYGLVVSAFAEVSLMFKLLLCVFIRLHDSHGTGSWSMRPPPPPSALCARMPEMTCSRRSGTHIRN